MEEQGVVIKFPVLWARIAGKTIEVQNWEGKVGGAADVNAQIVNELESALKEVNSYLRDGATVSVTTGEGKVVRVPFSLSLKWNIRAYASDQAFRRYDHKPLKIHFGSNRHRLLWWLSKNERLSMNNRDGVVLIAAGYVLSDQFGSHHLTVEGTQLLERLDQEGPRTKGGQLRLAGCLIDYLPGDYPYSRTTRSARGPIGFIVEHAIGEGLLEIHTDHSNYSTIIVTSKGKKWLEERAVWLAHDHRIDVAKDSYLRRIRLVQLLPIEALNEFLVSDQHFYREAARERYAELTGSEWREEPI